MRSISPPFVVATPSGARIRPRLRVDAADQQLLRAVGEQLGRLASADVAVRCRAGSQRRPAGRPQARADRGILVAVGGGDHPDLQRPVGAGHQEPAGRTGGATPGDPAAAGSSRGDGRAAAGPNARVRQRGGAVRQAASPAAAAGQAGRGGGADRAGSGVGVPRRRAAEWAAQAATGAVRYDLWSDPGRGRWYADASWQLPARAVPSLAALRQDRALGVDLNAEHLDGWVLDRSGNPVGAPHTIPLHLGGLPASTRDGRLRAAVAALIRLAKTSDCRSVMVEDLDFGDARQVGREALGRGRRGKRFRRTVAGMPTRQFRDLLAGMATNAGLWVIAVDPGWTSRWGERQWRAPLNQSTRSAVTVSRHHAAAVVIGRRGLGLGARRRPGVPRAHRRMGEGELPARPDYRALGREGPGPPGGQRAAAWPRKTRQAERTGH